MSSAIVSLKRKIAPVLHRLSFLAGSSLYAARRRPAIRILMFHGVGGPDCPEPVFVSQMEYLARHYKVISLKQSIELALNPESRLDHQVVLTFDDGLRNNFTTAFPVLKRFNLPATFFVCPGLIENRRWLWAYEIEQRLATQDIRKLAQILRHFEIPFHGPLDQETAVIEQIVEWMKTIDTDFRRTVEADIRKWTKDFIPGPTQLQRLESMDWDELRLLPPDLITIGSHTNTHPILTRSGIDEMIREVTESRHWLEKQLDRPVDFFCYPNGEYNDAIVDVVRKTYRGAVTTEPGFFGGRYNVDLYKISRIPASENISLFAWRMFRPTA